jgi:hypothetical protein
MSGPPPCTSRSALQLTQRMLWRAGLLAGPVLYWRRFGALFVKRACCARRDRLAVITQLAVPIALVLVALWAGKAYVNAPDESPLAISM